MHATMTDMRYDMCKSLDDTHDAWDPTADESAEAGQPESHIHTETLHTQ